MKKRRLFLLCVLTSLFLAVLNAQEEPPLSEEPAEDLTVKELQEEQKEEKIVDTHLNRRLEMEIKTSTLSELAAWCRTLGLSEGGTREELSKRLREHFSLAEPVSNEDVKQKIITIESAQSSEYFRIDVIDEDYARLKGDVKIILKDGEKTHNISADEILFNRTRSIITASGNVIYEKKESDKTETFRGKSITVNIDNWSSAFLEGNSIMENEGSSYLFSGAVISRSDQDVTILKKAMITNGTDDNAYWSIRSSKLWLLPGSDFAIFNAVLNVGEIPVLYIPFFYFPADDVVFHPVIGYRSREGGFIQTTTYLVGQPKSESAENSLTKIIGNSNGKEKELQGLFLRSTTRPVRDTNSTSLKALLDYYVNLGAFGGLELTTPKVKILNPINLSLGVGFTRTLDENNGYSPYSINGYDGTFDWNSSNLFSTSVPFRYRMKLTSGVTMKYGSFTWNLPYYSDPYVDRDFMNRAESMDWMNMIQQGAALSSDSSDDKLGNYIWQLTGSINPSFPKLAPFISKISISNITTELYFDTLTDKSVNKSSPNYNFYAPNKYIMYSISGSISGTPVGADKAQQTLNISSNSKMLEDIFTGIGNPISPWAKDNTDAEKSASTDILVPPVLSQTFALPTAGGVKFSIDYTISPKSSSELQFMRKNWDTYEDVDWNDKESILTNVSGNANLNFHIDHSTEFFKNTITFSGDGTWREYSYLNEESFTAQGGKTVEEQMEEKRKQQYAQTNYMSSYAYNGTLKPFFFDPVFGQTNFQYSLKGTLVKSKRYEDGDGPELTPQWGSWVKEQRKDGEDILGLSTNKLSANFAAKVFEKDQNVSFSAELPPMDGLITANATFRIWKTQTTFNYRMEKPETENEWLIKPFDVGETINFGKIKLSHNMTFTHDRDKDVTNITNLKSALTLWDFTADYSMTWTTGKVFKPDNPDKPSEGGAWVTEGEPDLLPYELKLSYNRTSPKTKLFNNRLELSYKINTSVKFDLIQYTNSNFQFEVGFNASLNKVLDLSISATSQNAVIFRYFKDVPGMEDLTAMYPEGDQNNFFIDLFDSFNFADESKRKRSGFKMQNFNIGLKHHLGDWTAEINVSMYPYQKQNQTGAVPTIEIVSDFTLLVKWIPIAEIKSDIKYEGKNDKWTVK